MKLFDETLDLISTGQGNKLSSEQCINQGVELGAVLLKTSFGMVVCKQSGSSYTLKVSSDLVMDQLHSPAAPFNIKGKSETPAKVFDIDCDNYSGLAVLQGEHGGELVIQFDKKI